MKRRFDYFNCEASELQNKHLFLFDMDGTIYKENTVFEGTLELLKHINAIGGRYVFITNNSSRSVKDYVSRVTGMGITASDDDFFTSAQATALFIKKNFSEALVYCQGTKSLVAEIRDSGINVTEDMNGSVDVVLVGFDTELTSEKLRKTCQLLMIKSDVVFLATNPDLRCPVSFGYIPDCGSICQMLTNATGKEPKYIGKPERVMVDIVVDKLGYCSNEVCVIGDRLYTDIATGLNAGVTAIAVLTGEATVDDIQNGLIKPTYTFKSVKELYEVLL